MSNQMSNHNRGMLRKDREERLEKIGFSWARPSPWKAPPLKHDHRVTKTDQQWIAMYNLLKEFKGEHGHCLVPCSHTVGENALGRWVRNQRTEFEAGIIRHDRKELLEDIGFVWRVDIADSSRSLNQRRWDEMFMQLFNSRLKTVTAEFLEHMKMVS